MKTERNSKYWDKRAIDRLTNAEKQGTIYINRIKNIYKEAYRDIQKQINNIYNNYSKETGLDVQMLRELLSKKETDKIWTKLKQNGLDKYIKENYKSRISRAESIQAQLYYEAKKIFNKEELEHTMCYNGVINDSYYRTIYDVQQGIGENFTFSTIDKNVTNTLLNEKWSGKNYSQRIWTNTDILADSISQYIGGAILSGQGIELASRKIRDRFNVAQYYAERLVRTETNHFYNEASMLAYEEMGVDKYVFVATLDSRTSEICQSLDNKVFNIRDKETGVNYPPMHPNCRSTTRGYIDEDAEQTITRRARNPLNNKNEIVQNIPYDEWIKKYLNENEKRKSSNQKVKWDIIRSNEYKEKINTLSNNNELNESIYKVINKIFKHRDNTLKEDLYLLDYNTGEILGSQTNMVDEERINYNKSIKKALKDNKNVVAIHNHPSSLPPSDSDINACFENKYKFGIIAGHDGTIFKYSTKRMDNKIPSQKYGTYLVKYKKMWYNEYRSQLESMRELSKEYKFKVEEIEGEFKNEKEMGEKKKENGNKRP